MTEKRIEFFRKIAMLVVWASVKGIKLLPFSFYRTEEEQKKLFDEGKSKCDGYKIKSKHQQWLAIDFVIIKNGVPIWDYDQDYEILGKIWKSLGGKWGGDFRGLQDVFHFEL